MIPRANPTLMETFDADIRRFVLANIPSTPATLPALIAKRPVDLLAIYSNWRRRFVDPMPRRVHTSVEFRGSRYLKDPESKLEISTLVAKIEGGQDVRPHLSTRVGTAFEAHDPSKPKKVAARRDMDMLLNDWGVHHLHLSSQPGPPGFTKRGSVVLLAAFTASDAYLIDLVEHDRWADDRIVRIMVREWPDAGFIHRLADVSPDRHILTEQERKTLRDKGMQATVVIGDAAYMGSGFSTSGISTDAVIEAMQTYRRLEWFVKSLEADPLMVARTLLSAGVSPPREPDLHFDVMACGWGVFERKTRTMLGLP